MSRAGTNRRRAWLVLLSCFVLLVACFDSVRAPVTARGVLAPDLGERGSADAGPFRVVFAAPTGEVGEGAEIDVVFDRPLRALDAADLPPPKLELEPELGGTLRWVGTRALTFVPSAGELPSATEFRVRVPAATRALDGSTLGAPFVFSFRTPRPKLVQASPHGGATGVLPTAKLDLRFNQAVSPATVQRLGSLSAGSQTLPFRATRPDPKDLRRVEIQPGAKLPVDTPVSFSLPPSFVSDEGPLSAGVKLETDFRTYGPLGITLDCARSEPSAPCEPGSSMSLSFNNAVRHGDVRRALSLTPAERLVWPGWAGEHEMVTWFEIPGRYFSKAYRVRVAAGLKDEFGQTLARDFVGELRFADPYPRVAIGITPGTLVPAARAPIPVAAVNVKRGQIAWAPLSRADVRQWAKLGDELDWVRDFVLRHPKTQRLTLPPPASPTQVVRAEVDPFGLSAGGSPSVFGLASDYERDANDHASPDPARLAKASDLGISAKLSRHGGLVWITRLSSGEPVADAEVELGADGGRYRTDAAGVAAIPAGRLERVDWESRDVVFASAGSDWTFELVRDVLPAWQLPVPTASHDEPAVSGLLFAERGLYRPGDTIRVKGIVRRDTPRGASVPRGEEAEIALVGPSDDKLASARARVSEFGTIHAALRVPPAARLGSYRIDASLRDGVIRESVEVREYQPAEFEVDVTVAPSAVRGDVVSAEVKGTYLYGGPMQGAKVEYGVRREPSWFQPPDSEGFSTSPAEYYDGLRERGIAYGGIRNDERTLDALGGARFEEALKPVDQRGPELVVFEATVTDLARRSQSSQSSVLLHPAEFYVGVRLPESFVRAPGKLTPELVALAPTGKRLAGKRVRLELVERRWTSTREDRGGPYPVTVSRPVERVVASCELASRVQPTSCALPLSASGYHLVRAHAVDGRGNRVEAAAGVYVFGEAAARFEGRDDGLVELVLDKPSYRVGDTAKVLIKSPFPEARALITIERANVLRHEQRVIQGSMPSVEFPVTEELSPNAFVSVHLVRKLGPNGAALPGGSHRVGYAELRIDHEPRRLSVELVPSGSVLEPGAELGLAIRVRDRGGKPARAELTVYAVDEGTLMLTGYRTPDPLAALARPRPLGVATLETRAQLARILLGDLGGLLGTGKGEEGGGGGDGSSGGGRTDFRQTAYFNPNVVTDAQGNAQVRFRLPDSLTSYRLMAVAVGEREHYGSGATSVRARKRLMLRPSLPRFVRAGDRFEVSVVAAANELAPGAVSVRAAAEGVILEGPATRALELGREQSKELRFAFRAERAGRARFTFEASGGGASDRVELVRPVSAPLALETVAVAGSTDGAAAEGLGSLAGVRHDVGELELSLASTALVGLEAALGALMEYPYGCTEQLASRLLPLLPLRDLSRDYGVLPNDAEAQIERGLRELVARQRGSGGFAMWADDHDAHPWVSAYALWLLHEARTRGEAIPKQVFEAGRNYLRSALQDSQHELGLETRAFALEVLASLGVPDTGYMNRLFEARADLPLFGRALLLSAFVRANVRGKAEATLVRELEHSLRPSQGVVRLTENLGDAYARVFDSPVRTHALVLGALARARPEHPLLPELARGLLSARRGGSWQTTQETAFALLALDAYRKVRERSEPSFEARVRLGQRTLLEAKFEGRSLGSERASVPLAKLLEARQSPLVFEREGSGTLHYQARLRYARRELPTDGFDGGFYVERRFRAVSPAELAAGAAGPDAAGELVFRGGELVLGELLVVTSSARDYVVIDDPLPAGFEAVDTSLLTSSSRERSLDAQCLDCDGGPDATVAAIARRELRDDRAVFFVDRLPPGIHRYRYLARATHLGRFVVPPLRAEEMYSPETFGRTGAVEVQVQ